MIFAFVKFVNKPHDSLSDEIKRLKDEVAKLSESGSVPALAVIIVGNDPASKVYVGNKKKACEMTGMKSIEYALDESTSEAESETEL